MKRAEYKKIIFETKEFEAVDWRSGGTYSPFAGQQPKPASPSAPSAAGGAASVNAARGNAMFVSFTSAAPMQTTDVFTEKESKLSYKVTGLSGGRYYATQQ